MSRTPVATPDAPQSPAPLSQAMVVGSLVFTSGITPVDPKTGAVVPGDVVAQTEQVFKNLQAILKAAGSGLDRAVKSTVHLADLERDFTRFNETYARFMPDPKPVRTTVGSALRGVLVEIDLVCDIA